MTHFELASLCQQVYSPDGIPDAENIGGLGAYCSVVKGMMGRPTVVVFRGTHDFAAWIEDLRFRWVPHRWGRVHGGFQDCWQNLFHRVKASIGNDQVICTGHSLGGAMATLAAADLAPMELVTFGSPRVGDNAFVEMQKIALPRTTRYVYQFDPVPWLPPLFRGFRHAAVARWHDGEEWQDGFDYLHLLKLAWHFALNMVGKWGSWRAWIDAFADYHQMTHYVEALRP